MAHDPLSDEFIRRFLLHILPKRYMKIRYFGFMFHRDKKKNIARIRALIDPNAEYEKNVKETVREIMLRITGIDIAKEIVSSAIGLPLQAGQRWLCEAAPGIAGRICSR